ncbi:RNA deprotection pyrophosphohydrolase [Heyndrickxia ginsengihumi]|uniref:RNA deprotection pyrophosphohydrolase n=1 Tax=Heyndrickxia ginsengihumi TaxID=363870 RepID=UPI00046F3E5F|nr:nucleoside triphosphatase YtkD [Heyndrickxia ginsengihumi]
MISFKDLNGNQVTLAFVSQAFSMKPKHVFVICKYQNKWLLTKHPYRGIEFPGGKIEKGETLREAAVREVYEETGGLISNIVYIGEYCVEDKQYGTFVKAIFYAEIEKINEKNNYYETDGPLLVNGDIYDHLNDREYSFLMKDQVLKESLKRIESMQLLNKQ